MIDVKKKKGQQGNRKENPIAANKKKSDFIVFKPKKTEINLTLEAYSAMRYHNQ